MKFCPHYVYVVATVKDWRHCAPSKIGISRSPYARLESLRTASPHHLDIAFAFAVDGVEEARAIERLALDNWGRFRLNGEWVDVPPAHAVFAVATCVEFVRADGTPYLSDAYPAFLDRVGVTEAHKYVEKYAPEIFAECRE